jgi:hypothetical protein
MIVRERQHSALLYVNLPTMNLTFALLSQSAQHRNVFTPGGNPRAFAYEGLGSRILHEGPRQEEPMAELHPAASHHLPSFMLCSYC